MNSSDNNIMDTHKESLIFKKSTDYFNDNNKIETFKSNNLDLIDKQISNEV